MEQKSSHADNNEVKKDLTAAIKGGIAHAKTEDALAELPAGLRGVAPEGMPYSIWQLAEHIRIAQWDMLEFSRNPDHKSPKWPDDYWPKEKVPASADVWDKTLKQITDDRNSFIALINDKDADLYAPLPHGKGQSLLREALQIATHTSYHTGEIIAIRRMLGAWKTS